MPSLATFAKTNVIGPRLQNMHFGGSAAFSWLCLIVILTPGVCYCQEALPQRPAQPGTASVADVTAAEKTADPEQKRLFGIIPNYRTSASLKQYSPLSTPQKFKIATQDSFDRGTFVLAAAFAAESQVAGSNPSFGSGAPAYGRYLGTAYADFVIGNFMTEAIYPSFLHQDPRYFRRGRGSGMSRVEYGISQLFWTHSDSGENQFNYSEVIGNSTAVAISNAYYPENRDAADAVVKLGTQLGVDMVANLLKEFSPDIYRKLSRKHAANR